MRFRDFALNEVGHFTVKGEPLNFMAMKGGELTPFSNVIGVDPRFEFSRPAWPQGYTNKSPKLDYFPGDKDYSLPVWDVTGQRRMWLYSRRDPVMGMMMGDGEVVERPVGFVIDAPNWADHAIFTSEDEMARTDAMYASR